MRFLDTHILLTRVPFLSVFLLSESGHVFIHANQPFMLSPFLDILSFILMVYIDHHFLGPNAHWNIQIAGSLSLLLSAVKQPEIVPLYDTANHRELVTPQTNKRTSSINKDMIKLIKQHQWLFCLLHGNCKHQYFHLPLLHIPHQCPCIFTIF